MAPTKKTRRKKPYVKKSKELSRWDNYSNASYQLWKDVQLLKELFNVEYKYRHISASIDPVDDTSNPNFYLLNGVERGTAPFQRTGQSIKIVSLYVKYNVEMITSVEDTKCRVLIILDKQPNQAIFALNDALNNVSGNEIGMVTQRDLDNRKRFVIMYDKFIRLNEGVARIRGDKVYKKMSMHISYNNANTNTIADISTNSIYLVAFSNQVTNNRPLLTFESTIRYIDN